MALDLVTRGLAKSPGPETIYLKRARNAANLSAVDGWATLTVSGKSPAAVGRRVAAPGYPPASRQYRLVDQQHLRAAQ